MQIVPDDGRIRVLNTCCLWSKVMIPEWRYWCQLHWTDSIKHIFFPTFQLVGFFVCLSSSMLVSKNIFFMLNPDGIARKSLQSEAVMPTYNCYFCCSFSGLTHGPGLPGIHCGVQTVRRSSHLGFLRIAGVSHHGPVSTCLSRLL